VIISPEGMTIQGGSGPRGRHGGLWAVKFCLRVAIEPGIASYQAQNQVPILAPVQTVTP